MNAKTIEKIKELKRQKKLEKIRQLKKQGFQKKTFVKNEDRGEDMNSKERKSIERNLHKLSSFQQERFFSELKNGVGRKIDNFLEEVRDVLKAEGVKIIEKVDWKDLPFSEITLERLKEEGRLGWRFAFIMEKDGRPYKVFLYKERKTKIEFPGS